MNRHCFRHCYHLETQILVLESILHLIQALGEVTKGDSIYTGNLPLVKIFSSPEIVRSHLARNRKLLQLFWILLLKKKGLGIFFFQDTIQLFHLLTLYYGLLVLEVLKSITIHTSDMWDIAEV